MKSGVFMSNSSPVWAVNAKKILKSRGIKLKELVDVFCVASDSSVGHYFNGRRGASIEQIKALSDFLGVSIDYLMREKHPDEQKDKAVTMGSDKQKALVEIQKLLDQTGYILNNEDIKIITSYIIIKSQSEIMNKEVLKLVKRAYRVATIGANHELSDSEKNQFIIEKYLELTGEKFLSPEDRKEIIKEVSL